MKKPTAITLCLFAAATVAVTVAVNCGGDEPDPGPSQSASRSGGPGADAPRVRFCISGTLQGRLEPCGCASGQWGGLARRAFFLQTSTDFDIRIEGGDLVTGGTELDVQKFYTALQVLDMGAHRYNVLGIGSQDLKLPRTEYAMFLAPEAFRVPAVSSDLVAEPDTPWPGKPYTEVDVRSTLVRIASLTMTLPEGIEGLSLLPPQEAWSRALEGAPDSTLRVLMVHDRPEQVRAMAKLEPAPDLVIGFTPAFSEPPAEPHYEGKVPVVFAGIRGRVMLDVSLARLPSGPRLGYHTVPLAGSQTVKGAMEDPTVKSIILAHRHDVQERDVLAMLAEQRPTKNGATYLGSKACSDCHFEAYEKWEDTRHFRAWDTLEEAENDPTRYGWPVTAYPDCVSCHVVGYGEVSGFRSMEQTPLLGSVGCEACHGPGSAHVASPARVKMGPVGPEGCVGCHDFEQTPDFDYAELWEHIKHS